MDGKERDWTIHYVANTEDDIAFKKYLCDAHTHGMDKYNHLEFQTVIHMGTGLVGYILNALGDRVADGETFKDGDNVGGIFEETPLNLVEIDNDGEKVLRVIIPDSKFKLPDDEFCEYPYNHQLLPLKDIMMRN